MPGLAGNLECLVEQRPDAVVAAAGPQPTQRVECDKAGDPSTTRCAKDVEGVDFGLVPLAEVESASTQPRHDVLAGRLQVVLRRVGGALDERWHGMVVAPQLAASAADLAVPEGDDRRELVDPPDLDALFDALESFEPVVHDVGDPVLDERPPKDLALVELGGEVDRPLPPHDGEVAVAGQHVDRDRQLIGGRQLSSGWQLFEELDQRASPRRWTPRSGRPSGTSSTGR